MLNMKKYKYPTKGGMTLWVRTGHYAKHDEGIVREVVATYLWDELPIDDVKTAIDIGAHIGAWGRYLRHLNKDCQIIAIEPDGENARLLDNNHYGDRKTFRYHAACRYGNGKFVIGHHKINSGGHEVVPADKAGKYADNPDREVVPVGRVVTVEEVMNVHRFENIDLLKLDCEGSEFDILLNMKDETLKKTKRIIGEHHCTWEDFDKRVGDRLRKLGFKMSYTPHPNPDVKDLGMFLAERK